MRTRVYYVTEVYNNKNPSLKPSSLDNSNNNNNKNNKNNNNNIEVENKHSGVNV